MRRRGLDILAALRVEEPDRNDGGNDDDSDYDDGGDNKDYDEEREDINRKKTFSFEHCPNHLTPPPLTPIRATWSSFFGSRNSRFESQFRTKNTIYTI